MLESFGSHAAPGGVTPIAPGASAHHAPARRVHAARADAPTPTVRTDRQYLFCLPASPCTASGWLARLLNSHPDVFCSHDLGNRARWAIEPVGPFAAPELAGDSTLGFLLSLLLQTGYHACGDVNGVALADWQRVAPRLPELWQHYREVFALDAPADLAPRSALLLRHPVLQADSYARIEAANWRAGRRAEAIGEAALRERARQAGFDWRDDDAERWAFLAACEWLAMRSITLLGAGIDLFRTEDLTGDPEAVGDLMAHLTDGELAFDLDLVRSMQAQVSNRHRAASAPRDPAATHDSWPPWRQRVFAAAFAGQAREVYLAAGYVLPDAARAAGTVPAPRPGVIPAPRPAAVSAVLDELRREGHGQVLLFGTPRLVAELFDQARARGLQPVLVHAHAVPLVGVRTLRPVELGEARWRDAALVLAGERWQELLAQVAAAGWRGSSMRVASTTPPPPTAPFTPAAGPQPRRGDAAHA